MTDEARRTLEVLRGRYLDRREYLESVENKIREAKEEIRSCGDALEELYASYKEQELILREDCDSGPLETTFRDFIRNVEHFECWEDNK